MLLFKKSQHEIDRNALLKLTVGTLEISLWFPFVITKLEQ